MQIPMKLAVHILGLGTLLFSLNTYSQSLSRSIVAITGEGFSQKGYYLNQTIGEAFSGTDFANFHFLTQGYQQPSLINKNAGYQQEFMDAIDVYPNPVSDHTMNTLTVSFRIKELTHYYIDIYNVHGARLIHNSYENLTSRDIKLDLGWFNQGIYFIHVYSSNLKMDRHFKIEKF